MRREKDRFEAAGSQVLLIGMGTVQEAANFADKFDVPFPIAADTDRRLYRAFDLGRMQPWQFFSPLVALKGVSAMAQGHLMGLPQGDVHQLPGVFIIDTAGSILYHHYSRDPSDHPAVDTLLSFLQTSV